MTENGPQTNGPSSPPSGKYIDTIDPDDPEYQKRMMRPADVREDVKHMEDRSRVSLILNSEAFRKELEEIVDEQIKSGPHPASLLALQQISDLLLPRNHMGRARQSSGPVIPISDIHGTDTIQYCKGEKLLRCKVASCYRLIEMKGWSQGIYNHISARINQEQEHFLINPFGLLYSEITASSLVKVDMQGEIVDQGTTTLGINKSGFTLHSAIHQARPDIRCIIHLHTPEAVAVSVMKCGFLPLSQEAAICGDVSYHDYQGILCDQSERDSLQRNLGPINKVMFLRNHGVVACGATTEEAFHFASNVMMACESQVKAVPVGMDNLVLIDSEVRKKTYMLGNQGGGGVDTGGKKWRPGEIEFEAQMRQLDNVGYRTGYVYKQPILKQEIRRDRANDVAEPPASSNLAFMYDGDYENSKYMSPYKVAIERQKQHYKAGWLNSPNNYIKQEMEETGTSNPKKITKWVQEDEDSPKRAAMSMKVENPNQFAPLGDNPKEFKQRQKQIRKDYYEDKVSAGPQSRVLEGMTWEEAQKLKAEGKLDGSLSQVGDSVIVIGAASKGIIQRDQQHNVQVYKSQYQANPFESMTEDEIERYKIEVQGGHVGSGEPEDTIEPGPDGKLISTDERMQTIQQQQKSSQSSLTETRPAEEVHTAGSVSGQSGAKVTGELTTSSKSQVMEDDDDDVFLNDPSPTSPLPNTTVSAPRKKRMSKETNIDDILDPYVPPSNMHSTDDKYQEPASPTSPAPIVLQRSESTREPPKSPELIQELTKSNFGRSKSERKAKGKDRKLNGDEKPSSPAKSDTLKSTDSASGGETLEDRSSKEGSPTKEHPSPSKDKQKQKKKKFRMPSFGKAKNKESKESAI
ncbi:alpha-adducin-like isoform X5 [Pecten maximus]|uniref:alpha-adducin-like isoform X5 n=1 Tax=Pecten maximus TaxID=6579 RepID=UPI0014586EF3|nr:alpha-adducin-like isoform X5 [Pecten maximus]